MKKLTTLLSSLKGMGLSVALHGGLAALAVVSIAHVRPGGNGGPNGEGEGPGAGVAFKTAFHEEGEKLDASSPPDVREAGPVVEDAPQVEIDPERPSIPFDAFSPEVRDSAVDRPSTEPEDFTDPAAARFPATLRGAPLPGTASSGGHGGSTPGDAKGTVGNADGPAKGEGTGTGPGVGDGSGAGHGALQIYSPHPTYPREARRQSIEGVVVVELAVHTDGSCTINRLLQSSGSPILDDAVVGTVATWKYKPALEGGHPVTAIEKIRFVFQLSK